MSEHFSPQPYPLWATWQPAPGGGWHVGLVLGWQTADGTPLPLVRGLWDLSASPAAVSVYALALTVEDAQAMADEIQGAQQARNRSVITTQ